MRLPARYAITETCLAMTIFRDEFNVNFIGLFTILLFLKIFHWLMSDRIAFMEQTPAVPLSTHARILLLMSALTALDAAFLHHAVSTCLARGPSVLLLFAFEYLILSSSVASTFCKYVLYVNDVRLGGTWEEKGVWLFYLDLVTDLFHMVVYVSFFALICTYYGLPLHILRDLYITIRNFRSRVTDFLRYRSIMRNMQERFPNATLEELDATDRVCIICREHMDDAKKLRCGPHHTTRPPRAAALPFRPRPPPARAHPTCGPSRYRRCGHMFHFNCLRSWLERQQSCPTCRSAILAPEPVPPPAQQAHAREQQQQQLDEQQQRRLEHLQQRLQQLRQHLQPGEAAQLGGEQLGAGTGLPAEDGGGVARAAAGGRPATGGSAQGVGAAAAMPGDYAAPRGFGCAWPPAAGAHGLGGACGCCEAEGGPNAGAAPYAGTWPGFPAMDPRVGAAWGAAPGVGGVPVGTGMGIPLDPAAAGLRGAFDGMTALHASPVMGFGLPFAPGTGYAGPGPFFSGPSFGWMPGMVGMPYHPLFASPYLLPQHLQAASGQLPSTSTFIQAQIDWLRDQLAQLAPAPSHADAVGGGDASSTPIVTPMRPEREAALRAAESRRAREDN